MEIGINIGLSQPEDGTKILMETVIPIDYSETEMLKYEQEEIKEDWGKIDIKKWLMPGLYILWQEVEIWGESGSSPWLEIIGPHVSVICYGDRESWNLKEESIPSHQLSGTVEIQNADKAYFPAEALKGNRNKTLTIIFSKPFLYRLLQGENWIKNSSLQNILISGSENFYQYFIELPIKRILNALLNENIFTPLKKYYFELKLKELFFMLHLQSKISCLESQVPADVQQKLVMAKAYLLTNYHKAPTIKQLSRIILLNEFKLKHFFKLLFGTTIKSYVITLRMEEAKDHLWNGYSINDVAVRLGYKNVSHFILIFKRTFGETPRQMIPKSKTHRDRSLTI